MLGKDKLVNYQNINSYHILPFYALYISCTPDILQSIILLPQHNYYNMCYSTT